MPVFLAGVLAVAVAFLVYDAMPFVTACSPDSFGDDWPRRCDQFTAEHQRRHHQTPGLIKSGPAASCDQ
jgi:hypothetical protein